MRIKTWKTFESSQDEWSIKRYGNANVVYYKGVIVGFDDRTIAEEENVKDFDMWTITLMYSNDIEDSEDMLIYVPNYIWQMFDLEDEYDISPAVKIIAAKMAENIYRPGFFIKLN